MRRQRLNVFRMRLLGAKVRGRRQRQPHPEGRHQRGHARLGDQRRRHLLPAGLGAGLASLPDDGARFSQGDRRRSARADSGGGRAPARCRYRLRGRRQQRHRHLPRVPSAMPRVQLVGVEAGGRGDRLGRTCGALSRRRARRSAGRVQLRAAGRRRADRADAFRLGRPGLRHDRAGARLAARSRAAPSTSAASDAEALDAARLLSRTEGIIPALESAHAVAEAIQRAPAAKGQIFLVNLSGRGDKDIDIYRENFKELEPQ